MSQYIHLSETNSTSTYLKELLLSKDIEEGTVVYTDYQTIGRGQRGNSWESEKSKNLLFSIVIFPKSISPNEQFIISQIASLAVKDVLSEYTNDISIKWPNDIYWKDKKIGGMLIENKLIDDHITESILGIGININQEVFRSDAPNPISLKQITSKEHNIKDVLEKIVGKINLYYNSVKAGNTKQLINKYKLSLFRREGFYLYNDGKENFKARIKDIQPNGILILETKIGKICHFGFKEVKYIL